MVPSVQDLLKIVIQRGRSLRAAIKRLIDLLEDFGALELEAAIKEALLQSSPDLATVKIHLVRRREEKQLSAAVHLHLPTDNPMVKQLIKTHSLKDYEILAGEAV